MDLEFPPYIKWEIQTLVCSDTTEPELRIFFFEHWTEQVFVIHFEQWFPANFSRLTSFQNKSCLTVELFKRENYFRMNGTYDGNSS